MDLKALLRIAIIAGCFFVLGGSAVLVGRSSASTEHRLTAAPPNPNENPYLSVAAWYIDPQNTTTHASDSNSGTDSSHPLLTWGQIISRYGTNAPLLSAGVTYNFLSGQTTGADVISTCAFQVADGGNLILQSPLPTPQQTGTLSSVVQKSRTSQQRLTVTLGASGAAANDLIVDTTRGSRALLASLVSGDTWIVTQPLTALTVPPGTPSEDDTWADGDAYSVYVLPSLNVACLGVAGQSLGTAYVYHDAITAIGLTRFSYAAGMVEASSSSEAYLEPLILGEFYNVVFPGILGGQPFVAGKQGGNLDFCGGQVTEGGIIYGGDIDEDTYLLGQVSATTTTLGNVYIGGSLNMFSTGNWVGAPTTGVGSLWGPGYINAQNASIYYAATNAATVFGSLSNTADAGVPHGGAIQCDGYTTAYGIGTTDAGVSTLFKQTLSAANLSAASNGLPDGGFGDMAFVPALGCGYWGANAAVQP